MRGTCDWAVYIGELAAIFGIPLPDIGGGIFGKSLGHAMLLGIWFMCNIAIGRAYATGKSVNSLYDLQGHLPPCC
jgi:hypothetical protein